MKSEKTKLYYTLIALLSAAILIVVIAGANRKDAHSASQAGAAGSTDAAADSTGILAEKHTISSEIIEENLQDMGFLMTQEYDCTGVMSNSKAKSLFGINLPFTESSYLISYDATVEAGIDFAAITVEQDEERKRLTIYLPKAQVKSVSVDPNSFTKYEEKDGLGTRMTITDYNDSRRQFEDSVKSTAIEKGLLEKASSNAQTVVSTFVQSLIQDTDYSFKIVQEGAQP